jgi:imidazolonepropionase-like amidohydrolase
VKESHDRLTAASRRRRRTARTALAACLAVAGLTTAFAAAQAPKPAPAAATPAQPAVVTRPIAIVGATLIDGTGAEAVPDAVVVMENGKFVAAGPRAKVTIPAGAQEIDGKGKFVIPGLMDANVHLVLGSAIEFIVRYEGHYEDLIEEAAQVTLKNGLTTVFDSWGPLQPLMNVRDKIRRGDATGSRMFVAGNIVGFGGPFSRDFNSAAESTASKALVARINPIWEENVGRTLPYMTPAQLRVEIRKYVGRGIDFLKYAVSGHQLTNMLEFSPEAQKVIVEETHKAGLIVQTHTTNIESLRQGIEVGVDMMQHAASTGPVPIPESTIKLALERKTYLAVQPRTARRLDMELKQAAERSPDSIQRFNEKVRSENQIALIKAHVPLLLATDAGMTDPDLLEQMSPALKVDRLTELGEGHFLWLQAMVEKGMTPMEAIVSATRNIAAAYHKLDQFGTIEAGKLADVVILDADPLQDINNVRKISTVIKDGQVVDRGKLPLKKVLTAARDRHTSLEN